MSGKTERVRAWVLLKVTDPYGLAARIEKAGKSDPGLLTMGDEEYVVVRADVVEGGGGFNLVVPVDARDESALRVAVGQITERLKGQPEKIHVLRVVEHHPEVVHRAHSFITAREHKRFPDDYPSFGRQRPNSPGANPWG